MAGVDVNTFTFNFDLTFAALLMNADGAIYHTYGGRDWTDAQSHLSLAAFTNVLQKTLPEHEAYQKHPAPPKARPAMSVDRMPAMRRKPKQPDCYHCHMVHDAMTEELRHAGRFKRSDVWRWPDPVQVGFAVDKEDQTLLGDVLRSSAAAKAGLKKGDHLLTLGGRRILTLGDAQRVLHEASAGTTRIDVKVRSGGKERRAVLRLHKGWKEPSPLTFSWRPSMWSLSPKPGFGGPQLKPDQLDKLGLSKDTFAFRVGYLVTWGPNRHTGQNAQRAGLRKGDVILSVAGKRDFESVGHFHAWFRLRMKAGAKVKILLLRNHKRKTITLPVVE